MIQSSIVEDRYYTAFVLCISFHYVKPTRDFLHLSVEITEQNVSMFIASVEVSPYNTNLAMLGVLVTLA